MSDLRGCLARLIRLHWDLLWICYFGFVRGWGISHTSIKPPPSPLPAVFLGRRFLGRCFLGRRKLPQCLSFFSWLPCIIIHLYHLNSPLVRYPWNFIPKEIFLRTGYTSWEDHKLTATMSRNDDRSSSAFFYTDFFPLKKFYGNFFFGSDNALFATSFVFRAIFFSGRRDTVLSHFVIPVALCNKIVTLCNTCRTL